MNTLPKQFREPHENLGIGSDEAVLVALSGGADSTALLHMMCVCRGIMGFRLCAAHVNHNIRTHQYNNEALRDENFCRELCDSLGVELFVFNADVPALAKKSGESLETIARNVRYSYFESIMREQGIRILVTAHNSNDNLETQIFNLCRGSGTRGLAGIPQSRDLDSVGGVIFRPLLCISKSEILEYCNRNSLEFVTDSTNLETEYVRNRIRAKIIPELSQIFGNPCLASSRLACAAAEDTDFILGEAKKIYASFPSGKITLDIFNKQHPAIKRRLLCLGFKRISPHSLEAVHLNDLIKLAECAIPHSSISLPDKVTGVIEDGMLVFTKDRPVIADYNVALGLGINLIPGSDFAVLLSETDNANEMLKSGDEIYRLYTSARIKNVKIHSLRARTKKDGDTIRTGGMTKKVKKLLCEKKISLSDRASIPMICEGEELIYVPICAVCDRVHSKNNSDLTVYIYKIERI